MDRFWPSPWIGTKLPTQACQFLSDLIMVQHAATQDDEELRTTQPVKDIYSVLVLQTW